MSSIAWVCTIQSGPKSHKSLRAAARAACAQSLKRIAATDSCFIVVPSANYREYVVFLITAILSDSRHPSPLPHAPHTVFLTHWLRAVMAAFGRGPVRLRIA